MHNMNAPGSCRRAIFGKNQSHFQLKFHCRVENIKSRSRTNENTNSALPGYRIWSTRGKFSQASKNQSHCKLKKESFLAWENFKFGAVQIQPVAFALSLLFAYRVDPEPRGSTRRRAFSHRGWFSPTSLFI
jgi:hypothetical protein